MVCYCCVKGCKNNSISKKKDSKDISFHAFPSNPNLKIKWLRAIGRPNWDPPSHVRICSIHFSHEKVNQDGYRTRIKDDACPIKALPPNSNFEASNLEVCRICLATDTKMSNLDDEVLKLRFEAIAGFNVKNSIEGLPQFICYLCKATLVKCYSLIEKSKITQATLLDIFAKNGQITETLVKNLNRKNLNLSSSLSWHFETPSQVFEYIYNDEASISNLKKHSEQDICEAEQIKSLKQNILPVGVIPNSNIITIFKTEEIFHETEENNDFNGSMTCNDISNSNTDVKDFKIISISNQDESEELQEFKVPTSDDEQSYNDSLSVNDSPQHSPVTNCVSINRELDVKKNPNLRKACLTPDEVIMEKYFNIEKLTLQEQIDEWKKSSEKSNLSNKIFFRCDVCTKEYASLNTLKNHVSCHDSSRGAFVCPVCKKRFKSQALMRSHANHIHGKKFHCKKCPKTFNNVSVAKKHKRWHEGHLYKCSQCSFVSAHPSALGVHARSRHARRHACARCGHGFGGARGLALHAATAHTNHQYNDTTSNNYWCHECDISFISEGARRVHLLTTTEHKERTDNTTEENGTSLRTTCKWCGLIFPTVSEKTAHARLEHRRPAKKTSWRLPDDSYPTQCDHCTLTVNNRKEHWWHVRQQHPTKKDSYRPVITAVCDTCGKGFQNTSKLRIHSQRHGAERQSSGGGGGGRPRGVHDSPAPGRQRAVHGPARPHACTLCPRAFKLKAQLTRHARVHTGATPYECIICEKKFKYSTSVTLHVRTVHYRLPHPPRKRRTRDKLAEHNRHQN